MNCLFKKTLGGFSFIHITFQVQEVKGINLGNNPIFLKNLRLFVWLGFTKFTFNTATQVFKHFQTTWEANFWYAGIYKLN
jgi:hypothetical protein